MQSRVCAGCGAPLDTNNLNKVELSIYCRCEYCKINNLWREVKPQIQPAPFVANVATNGGVVVQGNCNSVNIVNKR